MLLRITALIALCSLVSKLTAKPVFPTEEIYIPTRGNGEHLDLPPQLGVKYDDPLEGGLVGDLGLGKLLGGKGEVAYDYGKANIGGINPDIAGVPAVPGVPEVPGATGKSKDSDDDDDDDDDKDDDDKDDDDDDSDKDDDDDKDDKDDDDDSDEDGGDSDSGSDGDSDSDSDSDSD